MNFSHSYETGIRSFEKEYATETPAGTEHVQEDIIKGVRQGIEKAGMSSSSVQLIDDASIDNHDGTLTAGVFDRSNGKVGLAGVEHLLETIDPSVSDLQGEIRDQVHATLYHEQRHKTSWKNAQSRGEYGLIAAVMGTEADRLFQELMASYGTEEYDAYDRERSQATQLASRIGLTRTEVIQLLYDGEEKAIVFAALESEYIRPELN